MGSMGGRGRVGGQSGCERRIEIFVKIQKKIFFLGGVGGGGRGVVRGVCGGGRGRGQGGCERRIEVFVKMQKKNFFFFWGGGVGWRGRVGGGGSGWM